MNRPHLMLALAAAMALSLAPQASFAKSKAKDPACKTGSWALNARDAGPKSIIDVPQDLTWVVTAAHVGANSTVLLEYKLLNGVKGELAMQSGTTQLVEASTIALTLQNATGSTASGSFRCE
ncbi:hypothetical protein OSH11_05240 [Kaistia dalseonensis]|uniref:Uncharacterized protein n=1 Tax=Kaistia dalseonensis TaxID=410840 RepID=A0ABU0H2Z2_9HYPH|nr:hypothetical protein [Kaistia dalseonensis]MCX5494092.1 hypothetical protein [Kaistia dalseonensis]MDQ0436671.1 hypothetical protein [Kaistia dalseonensis]